jgi:hypothetical protein
MRSGKSTVAKHLVRKHGFTEISFAEPLKKSAATMFGLSQDQLYGEKKDVMDARWGVTPRRIMQYLGTDVMQFHAPRRLFAEGACLGRCFWAERLLRELEDKDKDKEGRQGQVRRFVISDLRFPHEFALLRDRLDPVTSRLVVFRVDNNDNNDTGTPSDRATILDGTQNALQHVSENEFLEIPADKVLHNNFGGGLDALYEQVDDAIQSVQLKL